jgi:hypothetical protein
LYTASSPRGDRLNKIYQQALVSIKEEEQQPNSVPIAIKLGLKKPPDICVQEYYPTFLSMAKDFIEGEGKSMCVCVDRESGGG